MSDELVFRAKTLWIVLANLTRWRTADIQTFRFTELFVEKFLPLHVFAVARGEFGEVMVQHG